MQASNPEKERRQGRCPLTPEEVGLMLRALGFGNDVHMYVASGEVYGGEETLAPLKALFPNFHSKEILASKEELEPFSSFSSRMAALDFIVCDESDVFVTNNNGNMAKMLAGRRYATLLFCIVLRNGFEHLTYKLTKSFSSYNFAHHCYFSFQDQIILALKYFLLQRGMLGNAFAFVLVV